MATASKCWLITGCSSGFGFELALGALRRGDKVIATARNPSKLDALKSEGAATMASAPLNELKASVEEAHKLYGRFDYLVNNAGYIQAGGLEELTPEETQAQFATNVFGLLNTTRAILPYMREQGSGVVANISSIGAWRGSPGGGIYVASKRAVGGISETLYDELAPFGIKVCTIEPGYFRSNFLNSSNKRDRQNLISDYEGTAVHKGEEALQNYNNKQPGDIKKGAKVIIAVLTGDSGKEVPMRLVLGADANAIFKDKCEATLEGMQVYQDLTCSTDHDD